MNPSVLARRASAMFAAAAIALVGLVAATSPAAAASPNLVISQVYGGGGNSGAPFTHDYVELFNRGTSAVSLAGMSVQYASATGNGNFGANTGQLTELPDVTLQPGQYYLIQQAGATNGVALPTPDLVDPTPISMAAANGKVALAAGTASLGCNGGSTPCSAEQLGRIIDLVGFGSANFFEGSAATPVLSNTAAALRNDGGCMDTDQNGDDFTVGAPAPRTTASPVAACGGSAATELFFSEYVEGSSNNKALEIYNGTGAAIDLAAGGYDIQMFFNGSSAATLTIDLTGSVAAGDVFVVAHSSASAAIQAVADQTNGAGWFNGDDAVVLRKGDEIIDSIGQVGFDPGSAWGSEPTSTANHTLRRKAEVCEGDTDASDAFDPAVEWLGFAVDTFDGLGSPFPACGTTDPGNGGDDEEPPAPVEVTIAEIQGTGATTPISGQEVVTTGVVTAAYPTGGFRGIYMQTPGTGGTAKAPGDASDGIFVFSDWAAANLEIGDCVEVEGTAGEWSGLTQLSSAFVTELDAAECDPVTATELATVPVTDAEKEVYEGMLVKPLGTYTITNNYQLNQFGQLGLAVGDQPLYQATEVVRPGPEALAYEAENQKKYITLDDGASWNLMTNATARDTYALPYLSHETPVRTASQVTFVEPVILDYRFQWNYQPTGHVVGQDNSPIESENDRPATAPEFEGNLTIGAFNVLNYFDDLGEDEPDIDDEPCKAFTDRFGEPVATDFCIVRGAYSEAAFNDQEAKLVAAINKSGSDVLGLMEIEASNQVPYLNHHRDRTLNTLVVALNEDAGYARWAAVPSPVVTPPNEDIIRTAFIYNPATVQLLGPSQILIDPAFADAREPLAQKFKARQTGNPFVMIANHFKSKGSGFNDGTGQGNANPSREAQAAALTTWANTQFKGDSVFLVGDFNAYSMETPMQIMEAAGYTNLAKTYEPMSHTYQYQGRLGSLDHVLANDKAMRLVTGAEVWDINADEAIAFQYSRRNYNLIDYHRDDEYASSDHDAVLVGLNTGPRGKGNPGQGNPGQGNPGKGNNSGKGNPGKGNPGKGKGPLNPV